MVCTYIKEQPSDFPPGELKVEDIFDIFITPGTWVGGWWGRWWYGARGVAVGLYLVDSDPFMEHTQHDGWILLFLCLVKKIWNFVLMIESCQDEINVGKIIDLRQVDLIWNVFQNLKSVSQKKL